MVFWCLCEVGRGHFADCVILFGYCTAFEASIWVEVNTLSNCFCLFALLGLRFLRVHNANFSIFVTRLEVEGLIPCLRSSELGHGNLPWCVLLRAVQLDREFACSYSLSLNLRSTNLHLFQLAWESHECVRLEEVPWLWLISEQRIRFDGGRILRIYLLSLAKRSDFLKLALLSQVVLKIYVFRPVRALAFKYDASFTPTANFANLVQLRLI